MIVEPVTDTLADAVVSAVMHEGFTVTTRDGRPARLAIIDDQGNVLDAGKPVASELWNVALAVHRNFLIGQGHLRVLTSPTGLITQQPRGKKAAA